MNLRFVSRPLLFAGMALYVTGCACCREAERSSTAAPAAPEPAPAQVAQEAPVSERSTDPRATGAAAPARAPAPAPAPAGRFTGTLRGGVIAVGAETTGWQLERPDGSRVDVDVSKAADAAGRLDGKPVVIHGGMTMANWVERGEKPLLIADRIEPAPPDGK
jgi:hypothetical protein